MKDLKSAFFSRTYIISSDCSIYIEQNVLFEALHYLIKMPEVNSEHGIFRSRNEPWIKTIIANLFLRFLLRLMCGVPPQVNYLPGDQPSDTRN